MLRVPLHNLIKDDLKSFFLPAAQGTRLTLFWLCLSRVGVLAVFPRIRVEPDRSRF